MIRDLFHLNSSRPKSPDCSVLIVSEDHSVLALITAILKQQNYRVLSTMNVAETLQLLDVNSPDVLICDFARPEIEGKQLLEVARLRLGKSAMPAIVFLRKTEQDDALVREMGADDLILEPFSSETLVERIDRVLAHHLDG